MPQRFVVPPNWPRPPQGWLPPAGWQPDPSWGPAPAGWQFWTNDGTDHVRDGAPTVPHPTVPATVPELIGDDGRVALIGDHLVLSFAGKASSSALKKTISVRAYPLVAIVDVRVDPAGYRGHPTLTVHLQPGADPLRPLLNGLQPDPGSDPDTLILRKGGTVPEADAFAALVRNRSASLARTMPSAPVLVDTGRLPIVVSGTNTRATFDGATLTLEVSSRTAPPAKKNGYPRRLPVEAIADVLLVHPAPTGLLRFLLAGGPGRDVAVDPKADLDTIELHADSSPSYAIFTAAVLTAIRRSRTVVHPELLSAAPRPALPPAPSTPFGSAAEPPALTDTPEQAPDPALTLPSDHREPAGSPDPARPATDLEVSRPMAPGVPMTAMPPTKPGWRERRADKREAKEHAAAVTAWQSEQTLLDRLAQAAHAATGPGGGAGSGIILKAGEVAVWNGPASLVEPRRQQGHYVGGYSGVSFRIAKGVRYSVGGTRGHYVPGPEVQTPIDAGRAVVTTQRVVFSGGKANREWAYPKLVSVDSSADDATVLISVSNRQKVSGLHLGKTGSEFINFLALAVAISQHGAKAVAAECEQTANAHRATQP